MRSPLLATFLVSSTIAAMAQAGPLPPPPPMPSASEVMTSRPKRADEGGAIKFTAQTRLLLVPTVVTDSSGKHVTGLTQKDFHILENGKEQKIASFEEIKASTTPVLRASAPAGVYTNVLDQGIAPPRLTVIMIDGVNTPFLDQAYAKRQVLRFLGEKLDPAELICLVALTRDGLFVLHDFTADTSSLMAALKGYGGAIPAQGAGNVTAAQQGVAIASPPSLVQRPGDVASAPSSAMNLWLARSSAQMALLDHVRATEITLQSFLHIAEEMQAVPGRKSLVWITSGLPYTIGDPQEIPVNAAEFYEYVFHQLNTANISVYPVDARGVVNTYPGAERVVDTYIAERSYEATTSGYGLYATEAMTANSHTHADEVASLNNFASMTGGKAFYGTNDIRNAVQRATEDSAAYYMVGYYLDKKNTKPGWRKLAVKVEGSGLQVRARTGYYLTQATVNMATDRARDIDAALRSPLDATGLPVVVRVTGTQNQGDKKKVSFDMTLPANTIAVDEGDNHISIDFAGLLRSGTAAPASSVGQKFETKLSKEQVEQVKKGFRYQNSFVVAAGEYEAHFVVRDNVSGRVGSILVPLRVQ